MKCSNNTDLPIYKLENREIKLFLSIILRCDSDKNNFYIYDFITVV